MSTSDICPLCGRTAIKTAMGRDRKIQCKQCGEFKLTDTAEVTIPNLDRRLRLKIGFWTREQNDLGEELPTVGSSTHELVRKLADKTVMERADRLLRFGISQQEDLGGRFDINAPEIVALTHSQSNGDVQELARLLFEMGWLHEGYKNGTAQISPKGFMHASESKVSGSVNGFIAMWFDKSMDGARDQGFDPAIRGAGYTPIIVSGVEHINKIDDEIISQIRQSKFLVADFTGHRGGVYFEAGFAMGLGLPVFWTCRQDDIVNLHFDIRQYNSIDWLDPVNLAKRLQRRIEAVVGVGPMIGRRT
jgi:nucleoside 2-deoxyribosyltransferase